MVNIDDHRLLDSLMMRLRSYAVNVEEANVCSLV